MEKINLVLETVLTRRSVKREVGVQPLSNNPYNESHGSVAIDYILNPKA